MKTKHVLSVSNKKALLESRLRLRILENAQGLFFKFGFARVTTDEIASNLGISKATLYKYFPSKEDLLKAVIDAFKTTILTNAESIIQNESKDFLERLVKLLTFIGSQLSKIGNVLAKDLRRYVPDIWEDINRFRNEKIPNNFNKLLESGIRKGVFRADINKNLILMMYLVLVQNFLNPDLLLQTTYSVKDIFEAILKVFFEGILTDKARGKYLEKIAFYDQFLKEGIQ